MRPKPTFRSIDPVGDRGTLIEFARDLFALSFGNPGAFAQRFGPDGTSYLQWITSVTDGKAGFASLALLDNFPRGLVVVGPEPHMSDTGHVYHYYLHPSVRGSGLGEALNHHALAVLRSHGFTTARLNVAPDNTSAIRFYRRLGWQHAGVIAGKGVIAMTIPC